MPGLPNYQKRRTQWYQGNQREMFLDIGYFLSSVGGVDLALTLILCKQTNTRNFAVFNELIRGMDMRIKIERIRKIAGLQGGIGPEIEKRFECLGTTILPLRNSLSHNSVAYSEDDPLRYYYFSLHNLPWDQLGIPDHKGLKHSEPGEIQAEYLFYLSEWLTLVRRDLVLAIKTVGPQTILELIDPKSNPQLATRPAPHGRAESSKPDKPRQDQKPRKPKHVKLSSAQKRAKRTTKEA